MWSVNSDRNRATVQTVEVLCDFRRKQNGLLGGRHVPHAYRNPLKWSKMCYKRMFARASTPNTCHCRHRRCYDSSWILLDYFSLNISIDTIKMPCVIRYEMPMSFVRWLSATLSVRHSATALAFMVEQAKQKLKCLWWYRIHDSFDVPSHVWK